MEKIITNFGEYLVKISGFRAALAVGVCGVALVFLVTLIVALTTGDFICYKKASKLIISGKTQLGIKRLKSGTKRLNKVSFDEMVEKPFTRSLVCKLPCIVFFAAITFGIVSYFLSMNIKGVFDAAVSAVVLLCLTFGCVLSGVSTLIYYLFYKSAVKNYYRMADLIDGENVPLNSDGLLPSTAFLHERVADAARRKENSLEALNRLFDELKQESEKPQTDANESILKETSALLNSIIKSE